MTDTTSSTTDDLQTALLDRTHRLVRQPTELNRRVARAFVNSMDGQRAVQRRTLSLVGLALEQPLLVARGATPDNSAAFADLEATYEEGIASLETAGDDLWASYTRAMTDGVEAYAAVSEAYEEFLDAWYRAARDVADRTNPADAGAGPGHPVVVDIEGGETE